MSSDAKDEEDDDKDEVYDRKAKIKQKVYNFFYTFVFPRSFCSFHWYWNILVMLLQDL